MADACSVDGKCWSSLNMNLQVKSLSQVRSWAGNGVLAWWRRIPSLSALAHKRPVPLGCTIKPKRIRVFGCRPLGNFDISSGSETFQSEQQPNSRGHWTGKSAASLRMTATFDFCSTRVSRRAIVCRNMYNCSNPPAVALYGTSRRTIARSIAI